MYIDDNRQYMPPNFYYEDAAANASASPDGSWVVGCATADTSVSNIERGVVYPYAKSPAIYHCPADYSTVSHIPSLTRFRSYSLNSMINCVPGLNGVPVNPWTRLNEVTNTATMFGFLDEDQNSIDDGVFGIMPPPSTVWNNYPSGRHLQGASLSFLDGHAEHWQWRNPKVFHGYFVDVANAYDLEDLKRLQASMF